jgi:6-phosphogluconate dehydrogenase (decarboxylating)
LDVKVKATLKEWRANDKVRRLWAGDKTLWTGQDEHRWLGWMRIVEDRSEHLGDLRDIADEIKIQAKGGGPSWPQLKKVPADVLSASLYTRFRSRQTHTFAEKVLSAMREKFGGHVERPSGG